MSSGRRGPDKRSLAEIHDLGPVKNFINQELKNLQQQRAACKQTRPSERVVAPPKHDWVSDYLNKSTKPDKQSKAPINYKGFTNEGFVNEKPNDLPRAPPSTSESKFAPPKEHARHARLSRQPSKAGVLHPREKESVPISKIGLKPHNELTNTIRLEKTPHHTERFYSKHTGDTLTNPLNGHQKPDYMPCKPDFQPQCQVHGEHEALRRECEMRPGVESRFPPRHTEQVFPKHTYNTSTIPLNGHQKQDYMFSPLKPDFQSQCEVHGDHEALGKMCETIPDVESRFQPRQMERVFPKYTTDTSTIPLNGQQKPDYLFLPSKPDFHSKCQVQGRHETLRRVCEMSPGVESRFPPIHTGQFHSKHTSDTSTIPLNGHQKPHYMFSPPKPDFECKCQVHDEHEPLGRMCETQPGVKSRFQPHQMERVFPKQTIDISTIPLNGHQKAHCMFSPSKPDFECQCQVHDEHEASGRMCETLPSVESRFQPRQMERVFPKHTIDTSTNPLNGQQQPDYLFLSSKPDFQSKCQVNGKHDAQQRVCEMCPGVESRFPPIHTEQFHSKHTSDTSTIPLNGHQKPHYMFSPSKPDFECQCQVHDEHEPLGRMCETLPSVKSRFQPHQMERVFPKQTIDILTNPYNRHQKPHDMFATYKPFNRHINHMVNMRH